MPSTLISMTNDEAVVADNLVTYKRAEITEQYTKLAAQLTADIQRAQAIKAELSELEARISTSQYTVDLYKALLDQFELKFPNEQAAQTVEEPVEPEVSAPVEDVQSEPIPEDIGEVEEVPVDASEPKDN